MIVLQDGDGDALCSCRRKQAGRSVLIEYGGQSQLPDVWTSWSSSTARARRVVALQRILQAVSDPFLGYMAGEYADYYVRQFHDMKVGIEMETLEDVPFRQYALACAATLARAHYQSPNAAVLAGYIGNGRVIGEALLEWAYAYADVSRGDYEAFVAAHPTPPSSPYPLHRPDRENTR